MQRHLPVAGVQFLLGETGWQGFCEQAFPAFDEASLSFVKSLSQQLLAEAKPYPNLASLGFFLRPAAIAQQQQRLQRAISQGRGLAFHLSPSNVTTVAVYSWISSLLSGCPSVVRLNSRLSAEQEALLAVLQACLKLHPIVAQRVRFIQYQHDDSINRELSAQAKVRLLWGGDHTLALFKRYATMPDCRDLCFADRRSYAVVDLDYWHALGGQAQQLQLAGLASDVSNYQQLACSSPILILSVGSASLLASFKQQLSAALLVQQPDFPNPIEQELTLQLLAAQQADLKVEQVQAWNWLELPAKAMPPHLKPENGNLLYCHFPHAKDLAQFSFSAKPQTCVMLADEPLRQQFPQLLPADRYVRPSKALQHEWLWDGQDLLQLQGE
ncbi:acyl-CoA reductase [Agarivorans sp. QJM3NY_33]|uniref:acyl-CoA reductase n=1 Tax=Agarivorans sp. QJM3NY_33 TaxID=3421432 RepID=UPI003D7D4F0B